MLAIKPRTKTNWDLCIFCQQSKNEKHVQPHKKTQYHRSYDSIQTDIDKFIEEKVPLPFNMTKECLVVAGAESLAKSLLAMKAECHKSCRDLIRKKEVERFQDRQEKRKSTEEIDQSCFSPTKKTRSSFDSSFSRSVDTCVCCHLSEDDSEEHLYRVATLNETFKEMALIARNWPVFTRLNGALDSTAGDV